MIKQNIIVSLSHSEQKRAEKIQMNKKMDIRRYRHVSKLGAQRGSKNAAGCRVSRFGSTLLSWRRSNDPEDEVALCLVTSWSRVCSLDLELFQKPSFGRWDGVGNNLYFCRLFRGQFFVSFISFVSFRFVSFRSFVRSFVR